MPITLDGTNGIITPMYNGSIASNAVTPSVNMKNRIINGAMVIDQRNAGASVSADGAFPVDRFYVLDNLGSGTFTAQQSSTAPTGFVNSLLFTTGTAGTATSSQRAGIRYWIEGYNIADLGFGTANAQTVTLSFWVRSSLTGTFAGSIRCAGTVFSYVFNYTVNAANTWEQKTITIAGTASGTWNSTNGQGMLVTFDLGSGTNFQTTANTWTSGEYYKTSGAVAPAANAGATFYITGVQLEVGSTATSFDYRPYGTELALCQRYYYKIFPAESSKNYGNGTSVDTTTMYNLVPSPVTMRVNPSLQTTGTASDYAIVRGGGTNTNCNAVPIISDQSTASTLQVIGTLSSGLLTGYSGWLRTASASSYLAFSAEL